MNIAHLESQALALPVEERAALAQRLLLSLEDVTEAEFDRLWGEESVRRLKTSTTSVPGDEVARKARSLLR